MNYFVTILQTKEYKYTKPDGVTKNKEYETEKIQKQ